MASKTYRATKDQSIDGYKFKTGDMIGTGDIGENIGEGEFTPADKCPRVTLGHIQARLFRGLVTDAPVDPEPPSAKEVAAAKAEAEAKKAEQEAKAKEEAKAKAKAEAEAKKKPDGKK